MSNHRSICIEGIWHSTIRVGAAAAGWEEPKLRRLILRGEREYDGTPFELGDNLPVVPEIPIVYDPSNFCPRLDRFLERAERTHHGGLLGRTEVGR
jgi:hypothetical protein